MKLKRLFVFILIIILLGISSIYSPKLTGESIKDNYEKETIFVSRVIDGDIIETDLGTIRLLGINNKSI